MYFPRIEDPSALKSSTGLEPAGGSETILVVEDQPDNWSDAAHEPKYGPKSYPGCSLRIDFTRRALYG